MGFSESDKREITKRLAYAALFTVIIYLTIPVARPVSNFLIHRDLFKISVYIIICLFVLACIVLIVRYTGYRFVNILAIAAFFTVYLKVVQIYDVLAEKIHFVEYGILAYLLYYALKLKIEGIRLYLLVFILVSLIGWGDELIQYFLPDRYYDFRDVILNALSGGLVLVLIYIAEKLRSLNSSIPIIEQK